jgi:phosphoenolpyruvate synthase/pyruvate phosphate dikinase
VSGDVLIRRLGEGAPPERSAVGGKAWSLDRLARLGLAVPAAFCVTTAAYRGLIAQGDVADRVRQLTAGLPSEGARAELERLADELPLPTPLSAALVDARAWLEACAGAAAVFAVRSSAVDEDSADRSFAGQHATCLGVAGEEIEQAVRTCWRSLWSQRSVDYRERNGAGFDDQAMAVVVQALVPAAVSAVAFTADPQTGERDLVMIDATVGLGAPLVAGEVDADTVKLDRQTLAVRSVEIGAKQRQAFMRASGEVETVELAHGSRRPALSEFQAASLARLALAVESAFGVAVDVEAAAAGRRWQLLQARPITTGDAVDPGAERLGAIA